MQSKIRLVITTLLISLMIWPSTLMAAARGSTDVIGTLEQQAMADPVGTLPRLLELGPGLPPDSPTYRRYLFVLSTTQMDVDDYAASEATINRLADAARKANDLAGQSQALARTALLRYRRGELSGVVIPAREALRLARESREQRVLSLAYQAVALSAMRANDYEMALQNYQLALKHVDAVTTNRALMRSILLNGISILHQKMHNLPVALQYNQQAEEAIHALQAPVHQGALLINRGYLLADLGRNEEAITVVNRALAMGVEYQLPRQEAIARLNLANIYLQMKDYRQATREARASYLLADFRQLIGLAANAREKLAMALAGQGDIRAGITEMQSVLRDYEDKVDKAQRLIFLRDLRSLYEQAHDYREALATSKEQLTLAEELYGEARSNAVVTMQEQFNANARAVEIERLGRENRLKATEIENKQLQTQLIIAISVACILVAALVLALYRKVRNTNQALLKVNEQLAGQSVRDPLTGLYNRRYLQEQMTRRVGQRRRQAQRPPIEAAQDGEVPDAFLLLDVDFFKKINDKFGHAAGDAVLVEVGLRLNQLMRDTDTVMRWGGEEFLIHLHSVYAPGIETVVQRVLDTIGAHPVHWEGQNIPVTVSIGCINLPFAQIPETELGWEEVLQIADMAMYLSKHAGRNQATIVVSLATDLETAKPALLRDLDEAVRQKLINTRSVLGPPAADASSPTLQLETQSG
ncbi:GGDEF domain-containing protein [Chitinimonas naiadis]